MTSNLTLYDKIWKDHLVETNEDGTGLLYIDRHLVHEVTSPQAFEGLRLSGREVRCPKKTIAGAIGSFFLTCSTLTALVSYYTSNFSMKILIIGFLISLACQLGDLFFSFLKREAKIKDSGNIFPGHGGVLDRLDGIFIGVPVGFISLILIF